MPSRSPDAPDSTKRRSRRWQSLFKTTAGTVVVGTFLSLMLESSHAASRQASEEVKRCLAVAADKYGLDYLLLKAIAQVESGFNPRAVRLPHAAGGDSTIDYGLMQINSTWLPTLKRWGISKEDLFDPCVSAQVGAWVLKSNFRDMGVNWGAVGAYNARSPEKRQVYAWRVYRALNDIQTARRNIRDGNMSNPHPERVLNVVP